jgi:lipoprotein-anchoring transpeptidase ErfK/SrfK
MAALVVAGTLAGTRAEAADTANSEAVVRRIVVSIPDRKLAVVENNEVVQVFAVAVGAPASPSPTGTFTIVNRVANPTYYHSGTVIAPGPQNPIGTRWIGLSQKGYGIHGTDQPSSIGYAKSHGCIRLRNADILRLYKLAPKGTPIDIL